jgi:hypothetical protein
MTKWFRIASLVLAGAACPTMAVAQTGRGGAQAPRVPAAAEREKMVVEQVAAAGGRGRLMASVETRITPGRPYSADVVTESLQVLGDGNRITKKSTTRVYRDNEGRTRREQIAENGLAQSITINDPVAGAGYTLDPEARVAHQWTVLALKTPTGTASFARASGSGGAGGGRGRGGAVVATAAPPSETRVRTEQATAARVEQAETSQAASRQVRQVLELAASGRGKSTKEDLGEQTIEGVRATGTRTTTVIPAGSSIGNVNEIRIVSEQWFSPDLEILVLTKHSDPRVGETTYKVTNIVRAQPDPNLFTVPPGYTVQSRKVRNE